MAKRPPEVAPAIRGQKVPLAPKPEALRPQTVPAARIKVIATKLGYYDLRRRREGDVFFIKNESEFSHKWMERAEPSTPLKQTTPQEALNKVHDDILGGRVTGDRSTEPLVKDDDDVEE